MLYCIVNKIIVYKRFPAVIQNNINYTNITIKTMAINHDYKKQLKLKLLAISIK